MKIYLAILTLLFTSCSAGSDNSAPAGFFIGFLQGFIVFIAWLISLFNDNILIYEPYNNGGWYDFGYILGLATLVSNLKKEKVILIPVQNK